MALLNSGGGREVLPRKYLIMDGEAFAYSLLEKIAEAGASCEVLNHYGPTETTAGSLTLTEGYRLEEFIGTDDSDRHTDCQHAGICARCTW